MLCDCMQGEEQASVSEAMQQQGQELARTGGVAAPGTQLLRADQAQRQHHKWPGCCSSAPAR